MRSITTKNMAPLDNLFLKTKKINKAIKVVSTSELDFTINDCSSIVNTCLPFELLHHSFLSSFINNFQ